MRGSVALFSLLVCLLASIRPAPAVAQQPGTHFLAELDGGLLLSGSGGPATRVVLGAGAKLKRFPARFYLVGQVGFSGYVADTPTERSPWPGTESGRLDDFALGPRVYLPIVGPLRLFFEGVFGATLAFGTYSQPGLAPLEGHEWLALALLSTGLQWRLLYALSLGVRAGFAFNPSGLTGIARSAGVHDAVRPSLTAGVTWLF